MVKEEIEFFDVRSKKKFKTTDYEIREKNGRFFAVTKSLSGDYECWRVVSRNQAERNR